MAEIKHIMLICGEPSGDLNASWLAKKLIEKNPAIRISAVGGNLMRQTGAEIYYDIKGLAVIGLFDVLKKLPKFFSLRKLILGKIQTDKPDALILVDFSGFNLRLAKAINRALPVIYYIGPQLWASRPGRIKAIKKYIDKVIVLFKFEEAFYKKYGLDVDCVGHPLLDIVRPAMERQDLLDSLKFAATKTTIALLPGSRKSEIENILPLMLEAALLINKKMPHTQFVIAKSPQVDWEVYNLKAKALFFSMDLKIVEGKTYDCLNIADFCIVASGTATLETAIMQKPFCLVYKMNLLNYLFYRPQVKLPYIGMVNIVAGKMIVPEFIQFKASAKNIAQGVLKILNNPPQLEEIRNNLLRVKSLLGEKGAAGRAAEIIINFLSPDKCHRQYPR